MSGCEGNIFSNLKETLRFGQICSAHWVRPAYVHTRPNWTGGGERFEGGTLWRILAAAQIFTRRKIKFTQKYPRARRAPLLGRPAHGLWPFPCTACCSP